MKEKMRLMLGIFFLLAVFSVVSVSAVVINYPNNITWVLPSSSGSTISGVFMFNVTNNTAGGSYYFAGTSNCSFYIESAGLTGNNTWITMDKDALNRSLSHVNASYSTAGLEDGNDYILNVTCQNQTSTATAPLLTAIIVDNTSPDTPTSLSPSDGTTITSSSTQSFSVTVVNRTTTSCTCNIARGGGSSDIKTCTASYLGTSCTASIDFTQTTDNGNWYWTMTASDGTQTTNSATNMLSVQIPNAGGGLPVDTNGNVINPVAQTTTTNWGLIIGVLAVIIVIVLIGIYL